MNFRSLSIPCLFVATAITLVSISDVNCEERRLEIVTESFDFGYVPQKSKMHRIFWLKNASEDTVKIHDVIPGCGCTQMPLDKELINPGDSARLELIFDSKRFVGPIAKRPQLQVEQEFLPYVIPITCYVVYEDSLYKGAVQPSPRRAMFEIESATKSTIQIENQSGKELTVNIIESGNGMFSVDAPKSLKINEIGITEIKLLPDMEPFESSITLEFVGPDQLVVSRLSIPVTYGKPEKPDSASRAGGNSG